MTPEHHLTFGPFRLEMTQGRLWRGDQVLPLRPRSLALLGYLVTHAGRLVTKAEVQAQVGGARMSPRACCRCRCGRFGRRWATQARGEDRRSRGNPLVP